MTHTDLAATAPLTTLATMLGSQSKAFPLVEYRGVLTPRELDAPAPETAALASGAAQHDLGWMRRVAVRGRDRARWLSGMVSNMVRDLPADGGAWNFVLNAQGRIQGDLTVWREGDDLELVIAADQYAKLLAHLEHFIIMDDVELVPLGQETGAADAAVGLTGPQADEVLGRMGLPVLPEAMTSTRVEWNGLDLRIFRNYGAHALHYELWTPAAGLTRLWRTLSTAGATPVGVNALEAFRIAEGIPLYGIDIQERDLPQETSQMRALHFNKGCYLGQEIVERIRSRGNVHRRLRSFELDGPIPSPGTELKLEGDAVGQVTSAAELLLAAGARRFALGMIRAEVGNPAFRYNAGGSEGTARLLAGQPAF